METVRTIHTSHFLLTHAGGSRLIRLVRSPVAFESREALEKTFAVLFATLDTMDRSKLRLLVDLRDGPSRNDAEFEIEFRPYRRKLTADFERVAVLVRSAVGKLQIQRHAREDMSGVQAFVNEALALAYLEGF